MASAAALAIGLGLTTALGAAAPAQAFGGDGGGITAGKFGTANGCSIISSPSYLGLTCPGGTTDWDKKSIKEILKGSKLPKCWHEPMTEAEKEALDISDEDTVEGTKWYWEYCLSGIDPKTLKPTGEIEITPSYDAFFPDQVITLDENQRRLIRYYSNGGGMIPYPLIGVSPSMPRVYSNIVFYNARGDSEGQGLTPDVNKRPIKVTANGVVLRARVVGITVNPLGEGTRPAISCAGNGRKVLMEDTPETAPQACWYRYTESSIHEDEMKYQASMTAHWEVDYQVNGGEWVPFNEFDKTKTTAIPVTEIQTVVVPQASYQ